MSIEHRINPIEEQNKLAEGLVKIDDGNYINMAEYQSIIGQHLQEQEAETTFKELDRTEEKRAMECFIATKVYGDINAPQVQTLREIRDNVLMREPLGKAFVNFYYSGAGKRSADFIENKIPLLIPVIKRGLDCLVERYSAQKR